MDHLPPKPTVLKTFYRRPALVLLATATLGFVAGFRYKAASYSRNEAAQRSSGLYVSVDRSGGGV